MSELFSNGDLKDLLVEVKVQNQQIKDLIDKLDNIECLIDRHEDRIRQLEHKISISDVWIGIISSAIIAMLIRFINACF